MFKKIIKKVKEKSLALRLVEIIFKNRSLIDLVSINSSNQNSFENRYEELEYLYLNDSEHKFVALFTRYIWDIFELMNSMRKENEVVYADLNEKIEENKKLKEANLKFKQNKIGYVTDYIEDTSVDVNKFNTLKYKSAYIAYEAEESHSDIERLDKFNELLNKEKIYLDGIVDCIDYCMNKKNKHSSIDKQLRKYLLTEYGCESVNMIINEMGDNLNE